MRSPPNGGATWISGGAGSEGSRSVVVGGLLEGGEYLVRLTARNSDGWGAYSNTILVKPRRLVPSAATLYHEVLGAHEVRLAWTAPASGGGTPIIEYGYEISPNGGATWISGGAGPEGSRSVVVGGLLEGGEYLVRLTARNSDGWGAYSNTILVKPRRLVPSAATLYHEVLGAHEVRLAWTAPASGGGTPIIEYGYEISPNGGATWISGGAGSEGSRSVVIGGLLEGGEYLVRLTARNSDGWGAYSNTILVKPRRLVPSAATLYHEVLGAHEVRLAWTAPASGGGTPIIEYGYEISPNGGATWISGGAGSEGSRSVVVGGLLEGGEYLVRLTARNSDGWGAYSNTILVKPRRLVPSAATLYHEVLGAHEVRLAWTAPASGGGTPIIEYGYEISPNGGATWISGGAGSEGSRSVVIGGLLEGGEYLVRLTARNSDGWGAYSNTILVKPGGSYLLAAVSTEDTVVVDTASSEPVYSEPAPTESPGGVATVVTEASETEVAADAAVALDAASSEPVDSEPEPTESPGGVATLVPEASEPDVAVGDLVFIDANRDGVQDVEDLGLGGVEVRLVDDSGTVVDRDVSDSAGRYQLESLASGSHLLEVVVPTGYQPTLVDVGPDDAVDSDPEPADVQIGPLETTVRIDLDAADVARLDVDIDIGLVTVPEQSPTEATVVPSTTIEPPTTAPAIPPTTATPTTTRPRRRRGTDHHGGIDDDVGTDHHGGIDDDVGNDDDPSADNDHAATDRAHSHPTARNGGGGGHHDRASGMTTEPHHSVEWVVVSMRGIPSLRNGSAAPPAPSMTSCRSAASMTTTGSTTPRFIPIPSDLGKEPGAGSMTGLIVAARVYRWVAAHRQGRRPAGGSRDLKMPQVA